MAVNSSHTPLFSTPYLTLKEYLDAPTALDVTGLVEGGTPAQNDAELVNCIARASSWMDGHCSQVLAATTMREVTRGRVTRDGELIVHPDQFPIIAITALSYGATSITLTAVADLSSIFVEPFRFTYPVGGSALVSGLQFGSVGYGGRLFLDYTYIAGYPNTTLAVVATAGQTTITVKDATGIVGGLTHLTIYDGGHTESVTVASLAGTVLTLAAPLSFDHATVGVSVSALPPVVKEAAILATSHFIKIRGSDAIVLDSIPGGPARRARQPMSDLDEAKELLVGFQRVA